jgi:hypothetical protein
VNPHAPDVDQFDKSSSQRAAEVRNRFSRSRPPVIIFRSFSAVLAVWAEASPSPPFRQTRALSLCFGGSSADFRAMRIAFKARDPFGVRPV